ncbi:MAG: ceramide glucosyltransferase [Hyphomicrobiales bacterium]|nr:ceramide glucosyltransferase [Hyphomicrobiales bacterium]
MLFVVCAGFAVLALAIHLASHLLVAWHFWGRGRRAPAQMNMPDVALVRPLCGVETFSAATLAASFALTYPRYELIFCVADARDPIIPMVEATMAQHPSVRARLLIGEERTSGNPKLDNMAKGFRAASAEIVVFADSNLLVPRDYLQRIMATWERDTGAVSAPPIGAAPNGAWSEIECSLLNSYAARWQYAVDALGFGFAQGKTLAFRRADLGHGGFQAMGAEPAEDAAATKWVRARGARVRLVSPPFPQPIGRRRAREVWARHLRWARLRRVTFPLLFAPEILTSALLPFGAALLAAMNSDQSLWEIGAGFALLWYAPEALLAWRAGWPLSWRTPFACVGRDLLIVALWAGAWTGRGFVWRGHAMQARHSCADLIKGANHSI